MHLSHAASDSLISAQRYHSIGATRCMNKGADEAPLNHGKTTTVSIIQYSQTKWLQRLGLGVNVDAIMDRITQDTIWIQTGTNNIRHTLH